MSFQDLLGPSRSFLVLSCPFRSFLALQGPSWSFHVLSCPSWPFLVLPGALWSFLDLSDPFWTFQILSGPFRSFLDLSDPSWSFHVVKLKLPRKIGAEVTVEWSPDRQNNRLGHCHQAKPIAQIEKFFWGKVASQNVSSGQETGIYSCFRLFCASVVVGLINVSPWNMYHFEFISMLSFSNF